MLELQRLQNKTIEIKKVKMMKSQIQKDKYRKQAAANCETILFRLAIKISKEEESVGDKIYI